MKFNENTRVQVPAALHLCKLGYTYLSKIPNYDHKTNILTDVFLDSLKRFNPGLSDSDAKNVLMDIISKCDNDDLGKDVYNIITSGSGVKMIDFDNPDNNVWHVTTEFHCVHEETADFFRPDITCFLNGLPLAFIEVKKPNNYDGILAERSRINYRMKNPHFRRFLNITQLMIFSNNQEYEQENRVPVQGAFYCCTAKEQAFFNVFREENPSFVPHFKYRNVDEENEKTILKHRNCEVIYNDAAYKTNKDVNSPTNRVITSMLSKERVLFLLRFGFAYVDKSVDLPDGTKSKVLEKHVMRYQQLFASFAIRKKLDAGVKSGIVWHTQGSGKTALAYYSVKSLTEYYSKRNTAVKFYFIVDRIALLEQVCDELSARGLVVRTASDRESLMADFRSNNVVENPEGKPEIMVVNIQKFKEDSKKVDIPDSYSTNLQRVFFIDEAHRGYNPSGSFLANLLESDRNAVKIALTGTPLLKTERESWRIFGDYINTYYYDKSIADGYTLKLMREPIETIYKEKIESIIDNLAGNVEVKKKDIDRDAIIEHENYITALFEYIVDDFRKFRKEQADDSVGAMVVCKTNEQARRLYSLWLKSYETALRIQKEKTLNSEDAMIAFSQNNASLLRPSLILHDEGDSDERKVYIDEFKKLHTVDVLIVNKMLLTGFDAPRLKKLYLGRKLDGHDLLQALTRVNRPYKDFKYGYVVDFVDIKENFDETNNRYLKELESTKDDEWSEKPSIAEVIIEDSLTLIEKMKEIKNVLFRYTCDNPEEFRKEIDEIQEKNELYRLRSVLSEAKAIINQVRTAGDTELRDKIASLSEGSVPELLAEVNRRISMVNLIENTDHKEDVANIVNLAVSELEFSFKKGMLEEMQFFLNDLRERMEQVRNEFVINIDHYEDKYVILAEEFRKFFKEKGYIPQNVEDAKNSIKYMDGVMKKIKEINRKNNALKKKYNEDEKYVRVFKRIDEENIRRKEKGEKPIISEMDYEVSDSLSKMKMAIDNMVLCNINLLQNEDAFRQDVLCAVSNQLVDLNLNASVSDRKYIQNLISNEYFNQYYNFL